MFRASRNPILHVMHAGVSAPFPERLAEEVEQNTKGTPEEDESHVEHDWGNETIFNGPWGDKLAEAIAPNVLIHGDGNEDGTGNRLVAVNGVGGCDCGNGGNLDTGAGVSNDDDRLCK